MKTKSVEETWCQRRDYCIRNGARVQYLPDCLCRNAEISQLFEQEAVLQQEEREEAEVKAVSLEAEVCGQPRSNCTAQ